MGTGQHGHCPPLLGIVVELLDELFKQGDIHLVEGLLEREGDTGVVDILGSEAKVDKVLHSVGESA